MWHSINTNCKNPSLKCLFHLFLCEETMHDEWGLTFHIWPFILHIWVYMMNIWISRWPLGYCNCIIGIIVIVGAAKRKKYWNNIYANLISYISMVYILSVEMYPKLNAHSFSKILLFSFLIQVQDKCLPTSKCWVMHIV